MTASRHALAVASLLALGLAHAQAQPGSSPPVMTIAHPQNVLQLTATGEVEVPQDLLTLTLTSTREGTNAAAVQAELRRAVDAALAAVTPSASPGQMEVKSGNFSVHPYHSRDGKINGWQGRASVLLEGRDFPRITQAAARATTMTIGQVAFGLSREQHTHVEAQAQAQAIASFKARAADIAKAFGFAGYTLREVNVNSDGHSYNASVQSMPKLSRAAAAEEDAPITVEPGHTRVQVVVSGSVVGH